MAHEISTFLGAYPPDMQAISQYLRGLVTASLPDAQEVLYADQNHIGYSFTGKAAERIIYICPMKNYVHLGFMRGTQLPDADHLLVGEGKWLRHIKIKTLVEANNPAILTLLIAANDYAKSHSP